MISIALAFLIGVLTLLQLQSLPPIEFVWLILPATAAIVWGKYFYIKTPAAALCGFLWCLFFASQVLGQHLPVELEGQDVVIKGRIEDFPSRKKLATRFLFTVDEMQFKGKSYPSPGKVRLNWYYADSQPRVGERWQFLVRLKQPHGFMNPGGFDYEAWLFQQRIRATGYVRKQVPPQRLADASGFVEWQRLRFAVHEKIHQLVSDAPAAGLLTALAIGERDGISATQWDVLRNTGTAHLMAISGLHIGLLAGLGYWLGNWVWRWRAASLKRLPAQKVAALVAVLFAFTYAAMAGFSIPTQRAFIMVCVVMLALWRQRFIQPSQVLAQSLLLVLLLDPLSALSAGFWLSFAAVTIILFAMNGRVAPTSKWQALLKMQWVVVLGLMPFTIGLFQQASLVSPLTNLLAIPLVSFVVVPLTLLACAMMFVATPVASLLLQLAAGLMDILWKVLDFAAEASFSHMQLASSPLPLTAAMLGLALLISPKGVPLRFMGLVFCLPVLLPISPRPAPGEVWLNLLDVGQGLATVVQTHRHTLVYDTGPKFSDSFDTGEAVIAPYLRHAGIGSIDMLMVTHSDNDHIGGANSLLHLFPVTKIVSSVPQQLSARAQDCHLGQHWQWDGVQFRVVHPALDYSPTERRDNNRSCVLRIDSNNGSALLTGDIETMAEEELMTQAAAQGQSLQADVLVVPHHGSKTSSSRWFIQSVAPQLALFPVGYRNRYHLPNMKVVQRYTSFGVQGWSTANSGAILLTFPGRHIPRVERYRQQAARFWHHQLP